MQNFSNLHRWVSVAALFYLALLGIGMVRHEHGLAVAWQVRCQCEKMRQQITGLKQENRQLLQEGEKLRTDRRYLEKVAREELQMMRDNELVFLFAEPANSKP